MSFDSPIDKKQGSVKLSEIFTDREMDIIKTAVGESNIIVQEQMLKTIGDALRRNNFIMHSRGAMAWNAPDLTFDSDAQDNDIIFRILQTEDSVGGVAIPPRTIDLVLQGSTVADSATEFKTIPLANNELLYLVIDRATFLAVNNASPTQAARIIVGNNVSAVSGAAIRLEKTSLLNNSGMPAMTAEVGGDTQTFYIPLAMRFDYTIGAATFNDLWWIPHGIRWPTGTRSAVGAVLVDAFETWGTRYIKSELDLTQAISDFSGGFGIGGIAVVAEPFTITGNHTLPEGMWLVGRSNLPGSFNDSLITVQQGASITMGHRSKLMNLYMITDPAHTSGPLVIMSGDDAYVQECTFRITDPDVAPETVCVQVIGNRNRIEKSKFMNVAAAVNNHGITYPGPGINNTDLDSVFT